MRKIRYSPMPRQVLFSPFLAKDVSGRPHDRMIKKKKRGLYSLPDLLLEALELPTIAERTTQRPRAYIHPSPRQKLTHPAKGAGHTYPHRRLLLSHS